ncbi:K(+) efflux antiporter 4 isoform X1 [Zea mays]|uniref:K(+) efflux antiporter 4 isoform X1 n=1 Tax=Zea mays TaxID=4577 RepID=UPI0004DECA1D|nr:K(+) efflux antiporter 4 isoform X1 [Zea mays]|eukprot:XP_008649141.1 K(+) efflux antiporter 4 isoform X1 [Zea mays]
MLTRRRSNHPGCSFPLPFLVCGLLLAAAVAFSPAAAAEAADGGAGHEGRAGKPEVEAEAEARGDGVAVAEAGGEVVAQGNATEAKEGSLADMIDRALEKEFPESEGEQGGGETDPGSFNNTVAEKQGVLETVARRVTKKNETKDNKSFPFKEVFLDRTEQEDVPTLIDRKDNVFIISNPKSKYPVLQLDLRLISDLVVVIVSATCGGIAFACLGQPVITGYLLAGSIIGPGGFSFVNEMVQVETVAQFGVIFLLFALGLEFSTAKLRVVRAVAVLGGLLQIMLFMFLCGILATLCGGKTKEGVFVGVLLSMSSTAVVLKFLMERNSINALHGQVTVGILILQDCAVGLLFALLPILSGTSGLLHGVASMMKSLVVLITFLTILSILSRTGVPWFLKLMISLSSQQSYVLVALHVTQTNELYQLAAVAFCLLFAWCSDKLGLSLELGSFAAGVMISTTDLAQHTLEQIEPIRNFFAALFLASIGMLINVHFLWNHVDILLAAVILVITVKTFIVAIVVKGFGYSNKTSLLVGMSLAQIGEFAFVLLSRASSIHLIEGKLYLLLLGTTALSLVTTPLLFKMIPAMVHLGVLLRWFSVDTNQVELGLKNDVLRIDSGKRINLIVQGSHDS